MQYDDLFNFLKKEYPDKALEVIRMSQKIVEELESLLVDVKNRIITANINNDFEGIGKYVMYCSQLKELTDKINSEVKLVGNIVIYDGNGPKAPIVGPKTPMVGPKTPMVGPKTPMVGPKTPIVGPKTPMVVAKTPMVGAKTPVDRVCFYIEQSGIKASGFLGDYGFVVLKGSQMRNYEAPSLDDTRKKLRNYLKENGLVVNGYFVSDYKFRSASEAASCVLGAQTSGNMVWHDENGNKLKMYVDDKPYNF